MKTLIVYYSRTGTTKRVAEAIAEKLGADLEEIVDKKDRKGAMGYLTAGRDATLRRLTEIEPLKKRAEDYDLVIIGTPIWSWNMSVAVRAYLSLNKEALKRTAFFSTMSGSGHERAFREMADIVIGAPVATLGLLTKEVVGDNYAAKLEGFINEINKVIR